MPMWNMTQPKIQEFISQATQTEQRLTMLRQTAPETMWKHDLQVISDHLSTSKKRKSGAPTVHSNKKQRK